MWREGWGNPNSAGGTQYLSIPSAHVSETQYRFRTALSLWPRHTVTLHLAHTSFPVSYQKACVESSVHAMLFYLFRSILISVILQFSLQRIASVYFSLNLSLVMVLIPLKWYHLKVNLLFVEIIYIQTLYLVSRTCLNSLRKYLYFCR